jgi:hypothetical protein
MSLQGQQPFFFGAGKMLSDLQHRLQSRRSDELCKGGMTLDLDVLLTCPDDDEPERETMEAVLRISESALYLWYPCQHGGKVFWIRRTFSPFQGPWPFQLVLTTFFAPNILFGRRNVRWAVDERDMPCVSITAFVPAEFWVNIHFRSQAGGDAVAGLIAQFWMSRRPSSLGSFFRRWWQAVAVPAILAPLLLPWMGWDSEGIFGPGLLMLYVITLMIVEGFSYRKDRPPQRRVDEPGAESD